MFSAEIGFELLQLGDLKIIKMPKLLCDNVSSVYVVLACMTFTLPTSYLGHILGLFFRIKLV